jgi:hypothetical protein
LALGALLVAVAWPLAWFGPAPLRHYSFFPLWLGYILTVDGLTRWRSGTSLLTRSRARFALLFLFSLPCWWLFEAANRRLGNWQYVLPRHYGPAAYAALASLDFSTVIPAIFVTAELIRTLPPFRPARHWIRLAPARGGLLAIGGFGVLMTAGALAFPQALFPLIWIGVFLAVDALNRLIGASSLAEQTAEGRWDTVLVLFAAGLVCGFFWEMWNSRSMPKWTYHVPYAGSPRLFEMPLLGYGGYLPFALELYALRQLLHWLIFRRRDPWTRFDRPAA